MDDPGRLTLAERYRQGIESLIHFDFERREEDLKWMLAESKKPVKGISWLKEKYYELLRKCEEHPVPFQLIYDLETIASRLFPRAARKFSFIKDPIPEYYRARLKIYEPELREIADSEGHIRGADLLGVLGKMGARDGRSMVEMFLARLKDGKSHSSLASKLEPGALEQLEVSLQRIPPNVPPEDLPALMQVAAQSSVSPIENEKLESHEAIDELGESETPAVELPLAMEVGMEDSGGWKEDSASEIADVQTDDFAEAFSETSALKEDESQHNADIPDEVVVRDASMPNFASTSTESFHSDSILATGAEALESPLTDYATNTASTFSNLEMSEETLASEDSLRNLQDTRTARDLKSDAAYKQFLIEQSELTQLRKDRIFELSGLPGRIDQAIERRNESESVQLLAEIHPLAFLTEQERLLRGLDAIESPLGKIMGHLSEMYRRLNTPDMREYVDYYSAKLEAGGLFDTFPTIRERLINYRNSLVDPPPELLKQVHTGLREIEDRTGEDHRECVAQQVEFLHECLENEVFGRVWPTIAVILENILKEELASLGETVTPAVSWRNRLQREEQTTPRAIANILAEVEPESGSAIAGILSATTLPSATARPSASGLSSATPGHRGTGFDFLANRSLDPHADAQKMQEFLTRQFVTDAHAAHALSIQILNSSETSLLEKETTLSVLEKVNLPATTELYHFDRLISSAGKLDDQHAFAESLRNGSAGHLVADRIQSLEFRRAQNQSMGHFSVFLATKDPSAKARLFQEITRDPHIPDGMKSVFRKGADANSFEKFLESITTSSQSNANKLKLLRILEKIAVHRNWLTPVTKERLENRIRFYERILSADREIAASVIGRLDYYRTRREEIRQALMTGKPAREKLTPPNVESPAVESAEEVHRHGFSDELLESLIQSPMRASRWYSKLPESSKEELHKQATSPGKAQILVNQIQKDIAFKKAIRHLKKPVEAAVFSQLSAQFPEPEYQERLKQFAPSQKEKATVAAQQSATEDSSANLPSGAIGPDASFDQLVNQTLLSGPDLPPLPEEDLVLDHRPGPSHPPFPAAISKNEESAKHDVTSSKPTPTHQEHHSERSHHEGARHEPHHERHPAKEHASHPARPKAESAVDGLAASLARGFSGLFSKKTSAPSHGRDQKAQSPHGTHDKKSGKKKADQAAATLMKAVSSYAKGEVYLSEKDLKSLEKEMEKHPNAKRLMEDHAYLFKVEHPDPAQFQPPIFVIIPEMKALNHDPIKKKAVMTRIEQSISGAPSKKKAHMQALLTFMERYKTK